MQHKQRTNEKGFIAGYQFTVSGSYYAATASGSKPKPFIKCLFELPEIVTYVKGRKWLLKKVGKKMTKTSVRDIERANAARVCKHYILRYLLPFYLKEKYPEDFIKVRTIRIIKKERMWIDPKHGRDVSVMDIQDMDTSQLMQFAAVNDLSKEYMEFEDLADQKITLAEEWQVKKGQLAKLARDMSPQDHMLTEPTNLRITNIGAGMDPREVGEESHAAYGRTSEDDGIPVDQQDPWANMID